MVSSYGGRYNSFGCIKLHPLVSLASSIDRLIGVESYRVLGEPSILNRGLPGLVPYGGIRPRVLRVDSRIVGDYSGVASLIILRGPSIGIPIGIYSSDSLGGVGR